MKNLTAGLCKGVNEMVRGLLFLKHPSCHLNHSKQFTSYNLHSHAHSCSNHFSKVPPAHQIECQPFTHIHMLKIGSRMGFSILPWDILTCRLQRKGTEPSTLLITCMATLLSYSQVWGWCLNYNWTGKINFPVEEGPPLGGMDGLYGRCCTAAHVSVNFDASEGVL